MVERVVAMVAEASRADGTLLAAAEDAIMARLRDHLKETGVKVAVGASAGDVAAFVRSARDGGAPPEGPMALQVPPEFARRPLVTPEFVAHAHAHDLQVHVWTINEADEMRRLLDLGVDGVMTDFPARLVEILNARGRRRAP